MKAKLSPIKGAVNLIGIILCIYFACSNIGVGKFDVDKEVASTANYIDVEQTEIKEENKLDDIQIESEKQIESEPSDEVVDPVVYDNKTLTELSAQLDKSLNSTISGKGYLIASYSLEKGVDPYMATAIILQETGCRWNCSYLVRECNNVGGQKGSGCGSYSYFSSLDDGIRAFIDNLYNNYISYGLTTPEQINPKYAEDLSWSMYVNNYIESIKAQ